MASEEKIEDGERRRAKHGFCVGNSGGNSTPSPTWKFGFIQADDNLTQDFKSSFNTNAISARKLGFGLWQMHPQPQINTKMPHHHSPSAIPVHPLVFRDKLVESGLCFFKMSMELQTVLHRIQNLEEKHELDAALVKKLRREVDQFQVQIQELKQEKERNQEGYRFLKNHARECDVSGENEDYQIKVDADSVQDKAVDGRRLREHSEKLHRQPDNEVLDVKYSLAGLGELERERKARILLEELCDEFAKEIRDYDGRVQLLNRKFCENDEIEIEGYDKLILHISEAWLDARAQMKSPDAAAVSDKTSAMDKLYPEIKTFLRTKQSANPGGKGYMSSEGQKPASIPSVDNNEYDPASIIKNAQSGKDSGPSTSCVKLEARGNGRKHQVMKEESTKSKTDNLGRTAYPVRPRGEQIHEYVWKGRPSPIPKWTSEISANNPAASQLSARGAKSIRSNTLREMLMEARLEDQQNRGCRDLCCC